MRILIPVSTFERAGGFRVLSELATHWCTAGASVDFLVDNRSEEPYFPTKARILRFNKRGLLSENAPRDQFTSGINAPSIYTGMLRAINQIAKNYDVILANHSFTALPVWLSFAEKNSKFYYIQAYEPEHYEHPKGLRSATLRFISRLSYKLGLRQIVNSPIYLKYAEIQSNQWVPPGIDDQLFWRREHPPSFETSGQIWIGTIGRSEPIKGTMDVLSAFEQLSAREPRVHLRVAFGNLPSGWSHPRCEVVMPRNDRELAEFYRSVDIIVAAGRYQLGACHYPVLEAMACGTPLITTGYLPADSSNAWLVPVCAPEQIASTILNIVSTSPEDLRKKLDRGSEAVAPFAWSRVAKDLLRIFSTAT